MNQAVRITCVESVSGAALETFFGISLMTNVRCGTSYPEIEGNRPSLPFVMHLDDREESGITAIQVNERNVAHG